MESEGSSIQKRGARNRNPAEGGMWYGRGEWACDRGALHPPPWCGLERRPEWTESIAVGGEAFARGIKERLGIRAKGRKVVRGESGFELREISAPYVDVFYYLSLVRPQENG